MEKLNLTTPNFTNENIAKLAELFPNCVTEKKNSKGALEYAIDFDLLRQEFSDSLVEGPQERYQLNWPGKREALVTANTPISKTLRPCREESVDFDTTQNIFIEGDNLDALKLLQETYLNKVKMIYIDPPYNTGKDFVYSDNFTADKGEYDEASGQRDEEGGRLVANPDSNGRFHSDWLSMMYPRLKLARNLLRDDGVIFISIDDNEVHNIRKICDEVFGEDNFVAEFIWKRRVSSGMADNNVSADQDYVMCYHSGGLKGFSGIKKDFKKYSNPDNDSRGDWISDNLTVGMNSSMRPNQAYDLVDPNTGKNYPFNPNRVWAFIPESMDRMIQEGRIIFPDDTAKRPMQKRFKNELKSSCNPFSTFMQDKVGLNTEATRIIQDVMEGNVFDYSKPVSLLTTLVPQICNGSDIVLDFFAGSGTTSHAVMQLNAEDGGNRKCISVQLAEKTDEKSEAFKAGYKNIAEIAKERIRRAGKKIKEDNADKEGIDTLDIGFRVFKIDSSNMEDVSLSPDETHPDMFDEPINHIKADRSSEDLLFQVLLDWGVDLTLPIAREEIEGKEVFFVDENALAACFDNAINETFVKKLAEKKPLRVVFRDDGFTSDAVKINVEQIFKLKSPTTDIKVI